jgi:hypothetical protein
MTSLISSRFAVNIRLYLFKLIAAISYYLAIIVLSEATLAQSFLQTGRFDCNAIHVDPVIWACPPSVPFPKPFGDQPSIALAFDHIPSVKDDPDRGQGNLKVAVTAVSPTSFSASVTSTGGIPNLPVTVGITWAAVGSERFTGQARAKYLVLSVIYAPPGTDGGHSTSSVSYASGSTTGTSTGASKSFKVNNKISLDTSGGILGSGGAVGVSFDWSHNTTDSQLLDIKKSTATTISRTGPSSDGIDHDEDAIYLLLSPTIDLSLSPSTAEWTLGSAQGAIQYVYVGQLNGHSTMPPGLASALKASGITPQDYPSILAQDPLASSPSLAPPRYLYLNMEYPYIPPYAQSDPVPTITTTIADSTTETASSDMEDSYGVGISLSGSEGFGETAKVALKDESSWQWTSKSTKSASAATSQTASVTIGGPGFHYPGPTLVKIYLDTLFHTFAFALVPADQQHLALKGTVVNTAGRPVPYSEVGLVQGNVHWRTFTDSKGTFMFHGDLDGPVQINSGGVHIQVPDVHAAANTKIIIP